MPLVIPRDPYKMAASRLTPFPTRKTPRIKREKTILLLFVYLSGVGRLCQPLILPAKWPKISKRTTRYSSSKKFPVVHPKNPENTIFYGDISHSLGISMNNEVMQKCEYFTLQKFEKKRAFEKHLRKIMQFIVGTSKN